MQRKQGIYEKYVKRILDVLFSMLFLILFWWLILVIALLVKIKLGSPVIFKQPRPGKNEKIFNMYKFRTMTDEKDSNGELLPDEMRLTSFGIFLRRTSCDELLEIFNILKGDMSFIGPRPLLVKYLERYNEEQHHRHDVRPGLTGYARYMGEMRLDGRKSCIRFGICKKYNILWGYQDISGYGESSAEKRWH